ncbi:hypothetical protein B0F90DRAFT_1816956 [Multifurca ochricompacta]|uniref:Uncharacterized protein n=1 Tax=Multifurca ochricompacta TaxID=376703 RepID=A0AAD4M4Y1_9AGAM|nr:hypothetical protein B0F90DRAFT_1816956 [Multifurca ochricompacta]
MEIVQCEPEGTFTNDLNKLVWFVKRYNNTIPEYIRISRMYLFGTPIRRTGAFFDVQPLGKLLSSKQENNDEAVVDDEIDFPLEPNGDLNFTVSSYGGALRPAWCVYSTPSPTPIFLPPITYPLEPYSWKIFQPRDRKKISGVAVHNLTYGKQNNIFLIFLPKELDEYKREEMGTWKHELKWQRRIFMEDPVWYFNRLVGFCFIFWLLFSLIPEAFTVFSSAISALAFAFSVLVGWARWVREIMLTLPSQARTRSF